MANYKETLNLPFTKFPMKANLAQREPQTLQKWQDLNIYQQLRSLSQQQQRDKFILNDGPPYANGNIHLGHSLNKILKDIVIKSHTLDGKDAPYVPGWDCHGLPIEHQVEKKIGKAGVKVSANDFRQACREYAAKQVEAQKKDFIRLGVFGDWDNPYLTMAPQYEADIIRALAKIIAKGHLVKGQKPVHWCLDCSSALAEAEVEYKDKTSPQIDVMFKIIPGQKLPFAIADDVNVVIWTTTPWTLPANQAVAVHAELDYCVVAINQSGKTRNILVAQPLLNATLERAGIEQHKNLATVKGSELEGLKLQHPFYERQVPIILGEHVTTDAGTGAVHTAPAHGQEDFDVAKKYNLPVDNPVGSDGKFLDNTPLLAGAHVTKANSIVIELLQQQQTLLAQGQLNHSYPHCWRHKKPLIFRATPQWFISMQQQGLRDMAVAAIDKVQWVPEWGKNRILTMMQNRPDWCISRQRAWGTPIVLFVHKQTGEIHKDMPQLMEKVAKMVEKDSIDAWFNLEPQQLLGNDAENYDKINDTLDVWFDSGVEHSCVLEKRDGLQFPADLYLEGSDQHRGWFNTSLLTSLAMHGEAPYKAVLTHGFTTDAKGHKMSKSLGNVIAPDEIIKDLGADILRLWVAQSDYQGDIALSQEILKRTSESYRRMRNTARFLLSNLNGFNPATDILDINEMVALDSWIVKRAAKLQQEIISDYKNYRFHQICHKLHNFCINDLGGFYLDIIKDRQYTAKADGKPRRSAQTAMYHLISALSCWIAPILSFTAEEIWQYIPGNKENSSIFFNTWYQGFPKSFPNSSFDDGFWQQLLQIRDAVNKELEQKRKEEVLGSTLEAEVTLFASENLKKQLLQLQDELRFVLITSAATVAPLTAKTATASATDIKDLYIEIKASTNKKCERCWHRREDVGSDANHSGICKRCVENLGKVGETRLYA